MNANREQRRRGAAQRAPRQAENRVPLEQRRAKMHAAEGHAGSVPRGNQEAEREIMGSHRIAWERVLGH
jgi:hypothetical protein